MHSFYGGPQGQSFRISAIFPNRDALADDLNLNAYSPVKLNEFVMISYGMQNLDPHVKEIYKKTPDEEGTQYYKDNLKADTDTYGINYNATLWQKIYKEDLEEDANRKIFWYKNDPYSIAALEKGEKTPIEPAAILQEGDSSGTQTADLPYCYICISDLSGNTPEITLGETNTLDPAELPQVDLDITNIDYPKLTFSLPRAVRFHWVKTKANDTGNPEMIRQIQINNSIALEKIGIGDYFIDQDTGKIYKISYIHTEDIVNDNYPIWVRIESEEGCQIDIVPNFCAVIDDSLHTFSSTEINDEIKYELTNPTIKVYPLNQENKNKLSQIKKDQIANEELSTSINLKYLIDVDMPKTYTPTDNHNIGYYNNNGQTIYMGDSNENDAFDFTTAIDPDNLSKYQFTATIPTPVSITGINQTHDYTEEEGILSLTNKYKIKLNNEKYNTEISIKDGRGIEKINKSEDLSYNLTDTYIITYNDKSTSTFEIENGNGIDNVEILDSQDGTSFALKITYTKKDEDGNKITKTTNYIPKLEGPQGDSVEYIELIHLEDTRTEEEKTTISDLMYVRSWLNTTLTVDKSKYDSTNKFLQINLITYGNAMTDEILLGSYQAWNNNDWWEVTGTTSGGTGTAQLDWIDLD